MYSSASPLGRLPTSTKGAPSSSRKRRTTSAAYMKTPAAFSHQVRRARGRAEAEPHKRGNVLPVIGVVHVDGRSPIRPSSRRVASSGRDVATNRTHAGHLPRYARSAHTTVSARGLAGQGLVERVQPDRVAAAEHLGRRRSSAPAAPSRPGCAATSSGPAATSRRIPPLSRGRARQRCRGRRPGAAPASRRWNIWPATARAHISGSSESTSFTVHMWHARTRPCSCFQGDSGGRAAFKSSSEDPADEGRFPVPESPYTTTSVAPCSAAAAAVPSLSQSLRRLAGPASRAP